MGKFADFKFSTFIFLHYLNSPLSCTIGDEHTFGDTTQVCFPLGSQQLSVAAESVPKYAETLEEEINILERLFSDLIDSTIDGFTDANISLRHLKRCLTQLPLSVKHRHIKFLAGNLVNILNGKTLEEVFAILGLYWDFMNCGLLVVMIDRFETHVPDVKKKLENYLCRLKRFRSHTKVKELIDKWVHPLPPYFGNLTMELDKKWRDHTLEELEEFVNKVCRSQALERYAVLLQKAESGCVVLTGAVQSSLPTQSLCVQISQNFLLENGVLKVTFKTKCVYNIHQVILVSGNYIKETPYMYISVVSRKYTSPLSNLSLSTKRRGRGGLYVGFDIFSRDYAVPRPHIILRFVGPMESTGFWESLHSPTLKFQIT